MERFDPEGCNSPEGEWKLGQPAGEPEVEAATGFEAKKRPGLGQTDSGSGAEEPNGPWKPKASQ